MVEISHALLLFRHLMLLFEYKISLSIIKKTHMVLSQRMSLESVAYAWLWLAFYHCKLEQGDY